MLAWLDRPWFHAVCGNHDFLAWRAAGRPLPSPAVDHVANGGWLSAVLGDERLRIGARLGPYVTFRHRAPRGSTPRLIAGLKSPPSPSGP